MKIWVSHQLPAGAKLHLNWSDQIWSVSNLYSATDFEVYSCSSFTGYAIMSFCSSFLDSHNNREFEKCFSRTLFSYFLSFHCSFISRDMCWVFSEDLSSVIKRMREADNRFLIESLNCMWSDFSPMLAIFHSTSNRCWALNGDMAIPEMYPN